MNPTWQDKDKRRAFLLSLLVHILALFMLLWLWNKPEVIPLESFLVIEVGTPSLAETPTDAASADAPAPQAAEPLVAASEIGEPIAQTPPDTAASPADPVEVTESEAAEPEVTEPVEIAEPAPRETPDSAVVETPVPQAQPEVAAPVETVTPEAADVVSPPVAEVAPEVVEAPVEVTPAIEVTTTLPEIDEVEVAPQPEAQALPIPMPTTDVSVSTARTITTDVRVQVNQPQAVPVPTVETLVQEAQPLPSPSVSAAVESPAAIPQPLVESSVSTAQAIPQPSISSTVSETQTVPQPQLQTTVSAATAVPQPNIQTSVTGSSAVPQPNVQASVASAQNVAVSPSAQVASRQVVPIPVVSAAVTAVTPEAEAGLSSETIINAAEANLATPGQTNNRQPGGNADRSGQTTAQDGADAANLGLAAGPEGSENPTGAPAARVPYRENRDRPLTVMLDNLRGYPQLGLLEASYIIEMPVEGGITRLMTIYDRIDPARVGPVRSTREYFLDVNTGFNGVMVHDGGSPGAMAAIERNAIPTINAFFSSTEVFQRSGERGAPYNLYSQGSVLRQELARRNQNQTRIVSGTTYRPEEIATEADLLSVTFSADYSSGFRYINDLNLYRWVRNGADASDANGEAIYVDAVLLANIEAVPVPGDTEGRLYIPMRGGTAKLYLNGRVINGRWDLANGVRFTTSLGEVIDLAPFKTWVTYAPQNASVVSQ